MLYLKYQYKCGDTLLNYELVFLNEYKQVDAICRDMFSGEGGISEYINQMEQTPYNSRYKIPVWDDDYRVLKRLRWVRNQIAHTPNFSDYNYNDYNNLILFHKRLINCQDSLALLGQLEGLNKQQCIKPAANQNIPVQNSVVNGTIGNNTYRQNGKGLSTAAVAVLTAAACLAVAAAVVVLVFWG